MAEEDVSAIGIDLGASSSRIAIWSEGRATVLGDEYGGEKGVPTAVSFGDERRVGSEARARLQDVPKDVVFAKRLLGRAWSDSHIQQADHRLWSFTVIRSSWNKPLILVRHKGEERTYVPEEIISMVLQHLVAIAEQHLMGRPVRHAVITVPASFSSVQREAMRVAGTMAGIQVLRLIDEPTSAALAVFGIDRPHVHAAGSATAAASTSGASSEGTKRRATQPEPSGIETILAVEGDVGEEGEEPMSTERTVLVFNLGGGTCDVSLIVLDAGVLEVKATAGSTKLGGDAFDNRLVYFFAQSFEQQQQPLRRDVLSVPRAVQKLRVAAEATKIALSSGTCHAVHIPDLLPGAALDLSVTREQFKGLCLDLFQICIDSAQLVLRESKKDAGTVNEVVLVGGCARIPHLQYIFKAAFPGANVTIPEKHDVAARGAAVQAGVYTQAAIMLGKAGPALDDLLVLGVTPASLGVRLGTGRVSFLLPRNATIPTTREVTLCTTVENQAVAEVEVVEGESAAARENQVVAAVTLPLAPAPFGSPNIKVVFDVDADGLLRVAVTDLATGQRREATAFGLNLYGIATGLGDHTMGGGE